MNSSKNLSIWFCVIVSIFVMVHPSYAEESSYVETLKEKTLSEGFFYDKNKSEKLEEAVRSMSVRQKKGIATEKNARRLEKFKTFYFDFESDFEIALQDLSSKEVVFVEWDKETLKRQKKKGSSKKLKNKNEDPEGLKIVSSLEMDDFRRATASHNGDLLILSSHVLNFETKVWEKKTNLQVIHPPVENLLLPPQPKSIAPRSRKNSKEKPK